MMLSMIYSIIVLGLLTILDVNQVASVDSFMVNTSQYFSIPIRRSSFPADVVAKDGIEFLNSVNGMPDLPDWMYYRFDNQSDSGYLYGSPTTEGDLELEIIAMNKRTYDTARQTLRLTVLEREKKAKFQVELKVTNFDIDDILRDNFTILSELLSIFRDRLWKESSDVYVAHVLSPLDVGGRLPLDPKDKEGVYIRIGSVDNFSRDLLELEREVEVLKKRVPCPKKYKASTAEHLFHRKPNLDFSIDWCSFNLIRTDVNQMEPDARVWQEMTDDDTSSVLTHQPQNGVTHRKNNNKLSSAADDILMSYYQSFRRNRTNRVEAGFFSPLTEVYYRSRYHQHQLLYMIVTLIVVFGVVSSLILGVCLLSSSSCQRDQSRISQVMTHNELQGPSDSMNRQFDAIRRVQFEGVPGHSLSPSHFTVMTSEYRRKRKDVPIQSLPRMLKGQEVTHYPSQPYATTPSSKRSQTTGFWEKEFVALPVSQSEGRIYASLLKEVKRPEIGLVTQNIPANY